MFRKIVLFILLPLAVFPQIPLGIGQWRSLVPYKNAYSIADAGDKVYVSANVFFFSYDKETGALQRYDKISGLSDVGVAFVSFNPFNSTLLVVYENANIDLIHQNSIINISDIKRKQMVGEKIIYSAWFSGNLAYLSASFGIAVLDMEKREIKDTYRIGSNGTDKKVFSFTSDNISFYAATEEGLKSAPVNSPNLANYSEWSIVPVASGAARHVVYHAGKVVVNINDSLFTGSGSTWNYFASDPGWKYENITVSNNRLMTCESSETDAYVGRVGIAENWIPAYFYDGLLNVPLDAETEADGTTWVGDLLEGLVKIQSGTVRAAGYPNGPLTARVQNMSVERGELWVAPGGIDAGFGFTYNVDGTFSFIQNWWYNYNQYTHPELENVLSLYDVAVHPSQNKVYFASWWSGLLEYDNGSFTLYDKNNSILAPEAGFDSITVVSGLAFDRFENLWMTSYGAASDSPIVVKKADGTWQAFRAPGVDKNYLSQVIVDDYSQKWIVTPKTNAHGILVFYEGDDFNSPLYRIYRAGAGNGNLPTNDVLCLAKDLDGEIWVGTAQGVAVFYCPGSVFSEQGCEAQQIIVTQNGVAGYLLENERVTTIAVDGANRKWIGTSNGVFLLSPDGTAQIAYYTVDNSPLLSNSIMDIAIDRQTGEVFIGTEKGVISIRGEATEGSTEHSTVVVFPNPVRENYQGPIAIKGLAANANVKITDVSGMLFYETTALGGQAVWDGRNYNGERAKTGVYLVFTSNEDGSSTHVTKLLIIN
jgi:hypothetical protein